MLNLSSSCLKFLKIFLQGLRNFLTVKLVSCLPLKPRKELARISGELSGDFALVLQAQLSFWKGGASTLLSCINQHNYFSFMGSCTQNENKTFFFHIRSAGQTISKTFNVQNW